MRLSRAQGGKISLGTIIIVAVVIVAGIGIFLPGNPNPTFHARDSDSVERLMDRMPTLEAKTSLMSDMQVASNDPNATNLDGMDIKQIHLLAQKRRIALLTKKISELSAAVNGAKTSGRTRIVLNRGGENLSTPTIPQVGFQIETYNLEQIEADLQAMQGTLTKIQIELNLASPPLQATSATH